MRNGVAAVAVAAAITVAFLAGVSSSPYILGSGTATVTTTSGAKTVCTISAEGTVILRVVNSTTGAPVASEPVQAQYLAPECPPNPHTTVTLSPTMTNATGYASFGGEVGSYYLQVDNAMGVEASTLPGRITCVTYGVPSGETHITYSAFLGNSCQFGL